MTKYASLMNHELLREIEFALQQQDQQAYAVLLQEVLNRGLSKA